MAERKLPPRDDDEGSLLSKLGTDSPKPRVKFGGMFCNVEGAFENKTLNFESFSPSSVRRNAKIRSEDRCMSSADSDTFSEISNFSSASATSARTEPTRGQTIVFPSEHKRERHGECQVRKHRVHTCVNKYVLRHIFRTFCAINNVVSWNLCSLRQPKHHSSAAIVAQHEYIIALYMSTFLSIKFSAEYKTSE